MIFVLIQATANLWWSFDVMFKDLRDFRIRPHEVSYPFLLSVILRCSGNIDNNKFSYQCYATFRDPHESLFSTAIHLEASGSRLKAQGSDLQSLASTLQALIRTHKEQNRRKMLQAFLPNVSDKSSENLNFTAIPKLQAKANFHLIS